MRVLLPLLLAACGAPSVGPREGSSAPPLEAVALSGDVVSLADLSGRPTLVVFWASWCGPCRREAPQLRQLAEGYGDRLAIVAVNAGEDPVTARAAARALQMSWPVVLDERSELQALFEVEALPLVLLVDGAGVVRYRGHGLPTHAHQLIDGLLG